jgi:hypothetical protein
MAAYMSAGARRRKGKMRPGRGIVAQLRLTDGASRSVSLRREQGCRTRNALSRAGRLVLIARSATGLRSGHLRAAKGRDLSQTTASAPAPLSPAERVKALYGQGDWRACVGAVDEALAHAAGNARVDLLSLKARVLTLNLKRPRLGLQAIEAAHRLDPDNRTVLETLARLRHAAGAAASAFAIYKRLYRAGDPSGRALRGLFDVLMGRKRYAAAHRLAPSLEAMAPASGAVARDLAEIALVRGDADGALARIDAARETLGDARMKSFQSIAAALKAELAAGDAMSTYRHLAIGGAAYCGSTTLGVILGSMDGYAFAGETHWLTNVRTPALGLESILATEVTAAQWAIACRVCGPHCLCFDAAFRLGLAADKLGWYAKIADRLGVENLVTTDKNLELYWERDPLFRFDHIILYKTPAQHLRSMLKQQVRQGVTIADGWVGANLDRWAQKYVGYLKTIRQRGRRVVVNWEAFAAKPTRHMRRLSSLLAIPLDPACLEHVRLGHFIGGNTGVDVRRLEVDPKLVLRPSNAPDLAPDVLAEVLDHPFSNWVMRVLDGEYRRDFPAD